MKKLLLLISLLVPSLAQAQFYPNTTCIYVTPTIDTAAYADGDVMGSEMEFAGMLRQGTRAGYIVSATIFDAAAQAVDLELIVFDEDPGAAGNDNAAFDPTDSDIKKIAARIRFESDDDRAAFSDNGIQHRGGLLEPIGGKAAAGTSLYVRLVARGAYDGDADSITIRICTSQD